MTVLGSDDGQLEVRVHEKAKEVVAIVMKGRGCFVSDLHMFSRRSQTHRYEQRIFDAATNCSTMILGGDIFDFRWSTQGDAEVTSLLAIGWLKRMLEHNADCQLHYDGLEFYNGGAPIRCTQFDLLHFDL